MKEDKEYNKYLEKRAFEIFKNNKGRKVNMGDTEQFLKSVRQGAKMTKEIRTKLKQINLLPDEVASLNSKERVIVFNNLYAFLNRDNITLAWCEERGIVSKRFITEDYEIYGIVEIGEQFYIHFWYKNDVECIITDKKPQPIIYYYFNEAYEKLKKESEKEKESNAVLNDFLEKETQQGEEMKEETKQKQKELTREQEQELIIKNAFEFLKRKDLIIVDGVITYPFLSKHMLKTNDVYGMYLEKHYNTDTYIFIQYKSRLDLTLRIGLDKNKELADLFTETYNRLKAQQEQAEQPQDDYYLRKHDKGKPKLLQVPVEAITAISEVMDYGSNKYGANSWQQVEVERYLQAGARHLFSIQEKDEQGRITFNLAKKDEESGIEHIKHCLCNLAYVVALYEMGKADETK